MSIKEVNAMLRFWQRLLWLRDWKIRVKLVRGLKDERGNPLYGMVERDYGHQEAIIYLRPDDDYRDEDGRRLPPSPLEQTLIHELLHIKLPKLPSATEEATINALASAMYRLRVDATGK